MKYGYYRISKTKKNNDNKIQYYYPDIKILCDYENENSEFLNLYALVKKKDTIIFESITNISDSPKSCFNKYQELYEREVNLIFLKEPFINTAIVKSIIQDAQKEKASKIFYELIMKMISEQIKNIYAAAQDEKEYLGYLSKKRIEEARLLGKQIGTVKGTKLKTKKASIVKQYIDSYSKDFNGSLKDKEVMEKLKELNESVDPKTFYKYKREMKNEEKNK